MFFKKNRMQEDIILGCAAILFMVLIMLISSLDNYLKDRHKD